MKKLTSAILLIIAAALTVAAQNNRYESDMCMETENAMPERQSRPNSITIEEEPAGKGRMMLARADIETKQMKTNPDINEDDNTMHKVFNDNQAIQKEAAKNNTKVRILIFSTIVLIMGIIILYLLNRRRQREHTLKLLRIKNDELVMARNEAEAAVIRLLSVALSLLA